VVSAGAVVAGGAGTGEALLAAEAIAEPPKARAASAVSPAASFVIRARICVSFVERD
jgi:hypothetical protein